MRIFDAHCDTLFEMTLHNKGLKNNGFSVDLNKMAGYEGYTQNFAIWTDTEINARDKFSKMYEKLLREIELNNENVSLIASSEDIKNAQKNNKLAIILSVEGAYMVEKKEDILWLYEKGVRCISLVWNGENRLAGGTGSNKGITRLGYDVIAEIERLGIILDVSHLSRKSFQDVVRMYNKPLVATHSNSKSLCDNERNLEDEEFLKICELGGCVGVNFYPLFLTGTKKADVSDIVAHIKHFLKIGGEDYVGIGSDFDGIKYTPCGINGAEDMDKIYYALKKEGISQRVTEKILCGNFERVTKEIIG